MTSSSTTSLTGFYSTELDVLLQARGITTVVFSGVATNVSGEGTARDAVNLGYRTVIATDAVRRLPTRRRRLWLDPDHDTGTITIDPDIGALHESSRGLALGPPKTAESARTITLPPFLVGLLRAHLDTPRPSARVRLALTGELHRRSNFGRRALRPAADGNRQPPRPRSSGWTRSSPGLTFHGLRHSHKTWMIADDVPEVAQSRRLGHILDDKIRQTYSHVAAEVEHRLLDALQERWDKAVADSPTTPSWRSS